jgi:CTD kinase subunit beta
VIGAYANIFDKPPNLPQEVSLSTLYVAAKLHDCLKKPRDLILACYAIRQPEMLKGRLMLSVDPAAFDPKQLESERKRMLSVERLVLETLCFNFMVGAEGGGSPGLDAFGLVIKLGRKAGCELRILVFIIYWTDWESISQEKVHLHLVADDYRLVG